MSLVSGRALIVEDDRSWQQILSEILTDVGLVADVVDNVEAATASLRAHAHRLAVVDLALGDGDYDNQDGLHVLDAIRRQDPSCAAILLTGFATVELAVSALTEHGALTCLRKESFSRAEFRDLVNQVLAGPPSLRAAAGPSGGSSLGDLADRPDAPGTALIVEDDAGWRGILSELLTDLGYEVRLCSSYGEALGRLRRDVFSLALVDLSLEGSPAAVPDTSDDRSSERSLEGYELLVSTHAQRVPTIVVSGVASHEDIESAYAEQGIFAYVQKQTFDRRAFLQTVREAQAARRISSELDCLTGREREVLALLAQSSDISRPYSAS
jgi:DNA-binding NtrC family response regulator